MESLVIVGVPLDEAGELEDLGSIFAEPPVMLEAHPFDGDTFAQAAGVLISGGVPVLIAWIKSRTERRKYMSISANGVDASGYTIDELAPVLEMLKEQHRSSDGGQGTEPRTGRALRHPSARRGGRKPSSRESASSAQLLLSPSGLVRRRHDQRASSSADDRRPLAPRRYARANRGCEAHTGC
jgi:hypothetical protein